MRYVVLTDVVFFVKQMTAYEVRISDWSSDVFSSDLGGGDTGADRWRKGYRARAHNRLVQPCEEAGAAGSLSEAARQEQGDDAGPAQDRKSTRLNSSH